jgi:hypothetical protein
MATNALVKVEAVVERVPPTDSARNGHLWAEAAVELLARPMERAAGASGLRTDRPKKWLRHLSVGVVLEAQAESCSAWEADLPAPYSSGEPAACWAAGVEAVPHQKPIAWG